MDALAFTPGPWEHFDTGMSFAVAHKSDFYRITSLPYLPNDRQGYMQAEANARLIASAPNMLAALREIEAHHVKLNAEAGRAEERSHTLSIARAAIAAATGQA